MKITSEIELDPGCGRKLGTRWIKQAKKRLIQLDVGSSGSEWADATPLSAHDGLAISIDTSVRSPKVTKNFFQISILHAMRDLHASFYQPTDFSMSVRFNDDFVERELEEFVGALSDIYKTTGARVGKIHSLLGAGPTEATVSVVGKRLINQHSLQSDVYDLLLLGEIETGTGEDKRNWRKLYEDGTEVSRHPGARLAKDVSGDGLSGALVQLAKGENLSISIELSHVPYSSDDVPLDDCNLDRNISDFEDFLDLSMPLDKLARATLMKPQFCGPLLVVTPRQALGGKLFSPRFVKIGSCTPGGPSVEVYN